VEITRVSSRFRVCVDSKGVTPSGDGQRIDFTSVTGELAGWRVSGLAKDRLVKGRLAKVRLAKVRLVKNRSVKKRLAEIQFVKSVGGAGSRGRVGVRRSAFGKHVAGNGKGRSLERPFLFLTLTKNEEKAKGAKSGITD
jgi:hypothetical protein